MKRLSSELENFFSSVTPEIESGLRALVTPRGDAIDNLDNAMQYALGLDPGAPGAGKRIRPMLCLLVCQSLSGNYAKAVPFALAIELMHNFCLVHDDIEDGDEFRRGRPAVWKEYGLGHGINVGDYLFTKIFEALLMERDEGGSPELTVRLFELMRSTLDHTHRGQALDMNARSKRISVEDYMHLVTEKTGHYLAAPLVAGAMVSDAEAGVVSALGAFGLMIGPLFQIRDDVIDLTHGKGRESIGSDVKEGKRSFMASYVTENGTANQADRLFALLDKPREETSAEDVDEAMRIYNECGAIEAANQRCEELKSSALTALTAVPEPLRGNLWEVTEFLAARQA